MDQVASAGFRRVVLVVALLNLGYFGVEFVVALSIGSVSLLADSLDFLEDASLNLLIAMALAWSLATRAKIGMGLAVIIAVPGIATLVMAVGKFLDPVPPEAFALSLTAVGALLVNLCCAILLARFRGAGGSLAKAAFLSARNDVAANIAIIAAALVTAYIWRSAWPDLILGVVLAILHADAAREVWTAAREEHRSAEA